MAFLNLWLLLVWIPLLFILFFVIRRLQKTKRKDIKYAKNAVHTSDMTRLPSYRRIYRNYRLLTTALVALAVLTIALGIIVTLRPALITIKRPELTNRDIMLCLDVSGSMVETDIKLLGTFRDLAKKFDGERLGLTLFDSSAQTMFPLTDDYEFIDAQIAKIEDDYKKNPYLLYAGTNQGVGSSLIGDGLAACAMRFDTTQANRSRSIILATDNYSVGNQIVNLPQAASLAKNKEIRVYGINPSDISKSNYISDEAKQYKESMLSTEGGYYVIPYGQKADTRVVSEIVTKITSQEATRFKGAPHAIEYDKPEIPAVALVVALAIVLALAWRVRV